MITEADILAQIASLERQRLDAEKTITAVDGAIQQCRFWLEVTRQRQSEKAASAAESNGEVHPCEPVTA